ncbi:hypothetical protein NW762_012039 [Fusarium torreyae]|uniref:Glutathione S-transferase n=1 Tax=Fusarium torreyae TaxID=1237075 RepID=A0A9W8RS82_9HYPO|nr:hypothetical protein NW762_012039 [Fusarium torreyae]
MSIKPIKLLSHATGPNAYKVAMVMEELSVPYVIENWEFKDMHTPTFKKYNPNGKVPVIIDPNQNDLVLWESGAIIEYLSDMYDRNSIMTPTTLQEKYQARQWLHFQTSGQGPYFGQASWFTLFHPEKLPSARVRYIKEIQRITKVIDSALQGREWLVGGQCTYADIALVPWYSIPPHLDTEESGFWKETLEECQHFQAWLERLNSRPSIIKVNQMKAAARVAVKGKSDH